MHVDKAKKRITKHVNRGFKGYPLINIEYFGATSDVANQVAVQFTLTEGDSPQQEILASKIDAREDETIQTSLLKIIERTQVSSVLQTEGVTIL